MGSSSIPEPSTMEEDKIVEFRAQIQSLCSKVIRDFDVDKILRDKLSNSIDFPLKYLQKQSVTFFCGNLQNSATEAFEYWKKQIEDCSSKYPIGFNDLIEICDITPGRLSVIYRCDTKSIRLSELNNLLKRGKDLLGKEEREGICTMARNEYTKDEFTDPEKKTLYRLVAQVNYLRKDWPEDLRHNWQTSYENTCAENGAFVRLKNQGENEAHKIRALMAMEDEDQILEWCTLLAEPMRNGKYPLKAVDTLRENAVKVNTHAGTLKTICPFRTLKSHVAFDLSRANQIVIGLTHTQRGTVEEVCLDLANSTTGLSKELGDRFNIQPTREADSNLNKICSIQSPYTHWGTISDEMLAQFNAVAGLPLSKDNKSLVCEILLTYLHERSDPATELVADNNASVALKSIVKKYGLGISRSFERLYRGASKLLRAN